MSVRPAKTQISLGIRPVWSESSLWAQWVAKDPSFLHADSEECSDWADVQADMSLRWAHSHIVGFVTMRLIYLSILSLSATGTLWSMTDCFFPSSFHSIIFILKYMQKATSSTIYRIFQYWSWWLCPAKRVSQATSQQRDVCPSVRRTSEALSGWQSGLVYLWYIL